MQLQSCPASWEDSRVLWMHCDLNVEIDCMFNLLAEMPLQATTRVYLAMAFLFFDQCSQPRQNCGYQACECQSPLNTRYRIRRFSNVCPLSLSAGLLERRRRLIPLD